MSLLHDLFYKQITIVIWDCSVIPNDTFYGNEYRIKHEQVTICF